MATIYTGYRNYTRFYMSWDVVQQDIANNRSLVNWTVGVQAQPGWTPYWGSNAIRINSVWVDGQGNLASGVWSNITLNNGATLPLRSGSVWIGHNGDGTKSFGVSMSGWLYQNGDLGTSGSMTAPTIPRNSQVTTNKGSYTLGEPITVYTNRKSSTFSHSIALRDNATNTTLATFSNIADSVTWTPSPTDITTMQNLIPNSNTLNLRVEQWNNNIGQGSQAYVPLVLTDANPIFSNFTYKDSNATVVAVTGDNQVLVRGQSILETTISAANKMSTVKGASPLQYTIAYDGVTLQKPFQSTGDIVGTIPDVSTIGQRTILVTATDSRNNNTSVSKSVVVYDYQLPTVEATLSRENNFGSDTTISIKGNWSPLVIGGAAKNSLTTGSLKYRYREDAGSFGSWTSRGFTATGSAWQVTADFVVSLDNTKKYIFEFQISDRFGTGFGNGSVDIGKPNMFIGERDGQTAVGIGKMPDQAGLDVIGPIYSDGLKVPSGGWSELGRIVGTVSTGTTINFTSYKYLRIVVSSSQISPPGTAENVLRIQFNGITGSTAYTRATQKITSTATALSTGTADSIIVGMSRNPNEHSLCELDILGQPAPSNICTGIWHLSSQHIDWLYGDGRYTVATSSPITSLRVYGSITFNTELIVYGHN